MGDNPGSLVWDSKMLHSGKLTRHWKITIFKRFHSPASHVALVWGCSFWKQYLPIHITQIKIFDNGRQAEPHWRLVLDTLNLNRVQYPGLLIILKGKLVFFHIAYLESVSFQMRYDIGSSNMSLWFYFEDSKSWVLPWIHFNPMFTAIWNELDSAKYVFSMTYDIKIYDTAVYSSSNIYIHMYTMYMLHTVYESFQFIYYIYIYTHVPYQPIPSNFRGPINPCRQIPSYPEDPKDDTEKEIKVRRNDQPKKKQKEYPPGN